MQLFNITWSRTFFSRWFLNNDIHIRHFYFHHFLLVEWDIQKRLSLTENSGLCLVPGSSMRPNLKNLSSGLKIWDAAQLWLVPLKCVFNVSRFKPMLNWNQFLANLRLRASCILQIHTDYAGKTEQYTKRIISF